ncbi:glutaredoxin family protein [Bacillus dakarensis]|uniref:glutaredoxin family protein n=1 Tax=Robertmurraya dakarensis TaxID=1926278 RepID=UPI000981C378|nr:glutaredoxin family protein [Bacillus dakarensis]
MKTYVKLYTRKGCHLCENAEAIVMELKEKWNFQYEEEDIDRSDELTEKYGLMIPVVEIDGEEVQFGQIDKIFLNEALSRKHLS